MNAARALLWHHRTKPQYEQMARDLCDYYVVRTDGHILSMQPAALKKYGRPIVLKPATNPHGYRRQTFHLGQLQLALMVNRVVAFMLDFDSIFKVHQETGVPFDKIQIDHINGKRDDDRLENLRPVTAKENLAARKVVKSCGPRQSKAVFVSDSSDPECIGQRFDNAYVAAKTLELYPSCISRCCSTDGKGKSFSKSDKSKWYSFKFAEQPDLEGEIWSEPCEINGIMITASNKGRVTTVHGVKTDGHASGRYRKVFINKDPEFVHQLIYRIWHLKGAPIPEKMVVMHVGLTKEERRCNDGTERNFLEDLVLGTQSENLKQDHEERKAKRQRIA